MHKNNHLKPLNAHVLAALLAASPEGFFHIDQLTDPRLGPGERDAAIADALAEGTIARVGDVLYDPARHSEDEIRALMAQYPGSLPALKADGTPAVRPIRERMQARENKLSELNDPVLWRMVRAFEGTPGYLAAERLCPEPGDDRALTMLFDLNMLKRLDGIVFDPLRITRPSVEVLHQREIVEPLHQQILDLLATQPAQTMPRVDLVERFGAKTLEKVVAMGGLFVFSVPIPLGESVWVRLENADPALAFQTAQEAVMPKDEDWQPLLEVAGEEVKPGAQPGEKFRDQVNARTYTMSAAARRLGVRAETLQSAVGAREVLALVDPEGQTRIGVAEIGRILANPRWLQAVEDLEVLRVREIKIAFGEEQGKQIGSQLRRSLGRASSWYRWGEIREVLEDPQMTLRQFRELYRERKAAAVVEEEEKRADERRKRDEDRRRERDRRDEERRQREELRARLLAAFPTWQHEGRMEQRVMLHVGPTNSGKTHNALQALARANSGWYLAPLRLLAFEIFDRLNKDGIRCNLLTGEEHIPVEGATVTAATIEMFNPQRSGEVVVIDEAHMLADPDRGWAWTRALMEARAPEVRIVSPTFARPLIERMASAVGMHLEVVEHERLTPLEIARDPWPLQNMPDRTILVAFSRRMVLRLKTELEQYRRTVSVVYGSLPPEVRRKQADRFAAGQTQICVATDAVGMGLNLPADNVCFFELDKFDGHTSRPLRANEAQQIGGRAGRYGLSQAGLVGATRRMDLKFLRRLFETPPDEPDKARVAPEVVDLELIPGSLSHRFAQWRELQSIPESLRDVIEPADIDERIALAAMLTDREVEQLGLDSAVTLVNAPTRESSRSYWYSCARAILSHRPMPLPFEAPLDIQDDRDLEATETAIACADIYLWLASREAFEEYAPDEPWVRALRAEWSMSIDAALLRRLDTAARCINCRKRLPLNHRYSLCDDCFHNSRGGWW